MLMPRQKFASPMSLYGNVRRRTFPAFRRLEVIALLYSFAALGFSVPLSCLAQTYSQKQLQEIYVSYLKSEGFLPELTESGNIKFKREGRSHNIILSESDPTYFVIAIGFKADTKSPQDKLKHLEATNEATATTKAAKAYLDSEGDLVFTIETVQTTPEDAAKGIPRMFRQLDLAIRKVLTKLRK